MWKDVMKGHSNTVGSPAEEAVPWEVRVQGKGAGSER